jgi:hypothetical protein
MEQNKDKYRDSGFARMTAVGVREVGIAAL